MKKQLLLISFAFFGATLFAQTTNLGGPISWKDKMPSFDKIPSVTMSGFDLQSIQQEDLINDAAKDQPWRFGYKYDTDFTLSNSGEWMDLPTGRLWRLGIEAPGAMTVNLLFEDFYLPEGSSLYLFDYDKTNRVGAYTQRNNRIEKMLGTELVHGDHIVVEYFEPYAVAGQGTLKIANVIHGYRSLDRIQQDLTKALNSSGECNIDVHCPLGIGWEDQIRAVAMIVIGGSGICTGALVNNTCEDGTPYFLTANHCLGGSTANWAFRFNWASPPGTEDCATAANSTDPGPPYDVTANGATVLVSGTGADHALLEIDNMTVQDAIDWELFYAGWNNDDTDGSITQATGIHHPSGDVMKICREDDSPYHNTAAGAEVWYIDQWEQGVTEPGSSGSPLFDQNGRIIGQLYGGASACSGIVNNGQYDYYGRFGVSWDLGIGAILAPVACGGDVPNLDGWDPNGPGMPDDASIQSVQSPEGLYCADYFVPQVTLRNAGSNNLTSCTINYNIDGGATQIVNWTGVLTPNSTETVYLPGSSAGTGVHVYNAFTTNPNGTADTNPLNDANLSNFEIASGGIETIVSISTDCWGYETYWEIEDVNSIVVAAGGNTIGIAPGGLQVANGGDPGSYGSETTINETLCLAEGCYDFTIFDDWGDGMTGAGCGTDGSYQISNTSLTVLATLSNVSFGTSETANFCVVDNAGINELSAVALNVYPNPSSGVFSVSIQNGENKNYSIVVTDLAGRKMLQSEFSGDNYVIDLQKSANGTYLISLSGENVLETKSIVLNK